ncbi:MAG: helix-turn-helix transcriptional regulator [Saprospiraceae bacterium]
MQRQLLRRIQSNLLLLNKLKIGHLDPFVLLDGENIQIETIAKDSEATFELLLKIADHFDISLDLLIRHDLYGYTNIDLKQLLDGYRRKTLKLPAETVVIKFITIAAASQYLVNPENDFPTFSLPRRIFEPYKLSTFRAFEIDGYSMPPITPGTIIVGELLEDTLRFEEGNRYIIIHPDGILFKRVFKSPTYEQDHLLILKSDNSDPEYAPFSINALEVKEMWKPFQILEKMND